MTLLQKTGEIGEQLPRGYRIAWYNPVNFTAVCYPIGIHVIAWAIHAIWASTFKPLAPDRWEKDLAEVTKPLLERLDKQEAALKTSRRALIAFQEFVEKNGEEPDPLDQILEQIDDALSKIA